MMDAWELRIDEAVNASGVGVGVILTSPNKQYTEMRAVKLGTDLSNNHTEYEALLLGMKCAHAANITVLKVFSDSQLVINQVQGTYAVHSENLQPYVEKAKW